MNPFNEGYFVIPHTGEWIMYREFLYEPWPDVYWTHQTIKQLELIV